MLGALLLLGQMAMAQKIDQRLTNLVQNSAQHRAPGQHIRQKAENDRFCVSYTSDGKISSLGVMAYLRKGAQYPTEQLELIGIKVNSVVDNIVSLSVPADKLMMLNDIDDIILVLPDEYKQTMNNDGRRMTNADKVSDATTAKAQGLPQAYTGSGVVMGIIDKGIDFNHLAFLNSDGTTRLKHAYIYQKGTTVNVIEYSPSEMLMLTSDVTDSSHGTHTSAIAAGSRMDDGWQGVAPDVDLILVGVGQNSIDAVMYDAMKKIFDYAESVHKPAVISISMGNTDRLHDGSVPVAKYVKEMTVSGTKQGRAVLISSSNAADNCMSIVKTLGDPDADGWQIKTVMGAYNKGGDSNKPFYNKSDLFLYADDGKDFTAELRIVNIKTGEVIAGNIDSYLTNEKSDLSGYKLLKGKRVNNKGETVVVWENDYNYPISYLPQPDLRLALFVKGTKGQTIKIIRTDDAAQEFGFMVPEVFRDKGYTEGNGDMAFNGDICDDAVISVGAYNSCLGFTNYEGHQVDLTRIVSKVTGMPQVVGEIADFSSYGVDDNGKNRPTVLGPGQHVLSAFNLYDTNKFDHFGNLDPQGSIASVVRNYKNDRNNWFGYMAGTSMSTPHVAGIVALWMQAKPTLTANEINDIMKQTCINDEFTDIVKIPSHNLAQAGYGKIDALAGLKKILGIETSIPDLPRQQAQVKLEGRTLLLQGQTDVQVTVYSLSGKQVMTARAKDGAVQLNGLASGVYAVRVGQHGSTLIRL